MIVNSTRILVFCTTTHTRVGSIILKNTTHNSNFRNFRNLT